MPGSSIFKTQQVTASASGINGMAWCSGPCSSPLVGGCDDAGGPVSMRGGSLICTVRPWLAVDDVRPTAECSVGTGSWELAAAGDEVDGSGCWTGPSPGTRVVTSVSDVICGNQRFDGCHRYVCSCEILNRTGALTVTTVAEKSISKKRKIATFRSQQKRQHRRTRNASASRLSEWWKQNNTESRMKDSAIPIWQKKMCLKWRVRNWINLNRWHKSTYMRALHMV